jgi:hypothetical protein
MRSFDMAITSLMIMFLFVLCQGGGACGGDHGKSTHFEKVSSR